MQHVYIDDIIKQVRTIHQTTLTMDKADTSVGEFLDLQATNILDAHQSGNKAVKFHLACWFKPLIGKSTEQILAYPLSIDDARQTIAAEHGFTDWTEVKKNSSSNFDLQFESAVDTMLSGDIRSLTSTVEDTPAILKQRSQYGHKATLLHYLGSNGVESYRQITPLNAVAMTQLLIDQGAEVDSVANIYGGSTAIQLILSSAHPHKAGVAESMAQLIRSVSQAE